MEYEIDDCDVLFDPSTNPSLTHRRRPPSRHSWLSSWNPVKPCRKAVVIPEEEEQLA
ncbi:MAG TPA: hypothetical protein VLM18_04665 [Croceibacterium sp.]|nr:hypothetical protein [Croceibacterium sp.]